MCGLYKTQLPAPSLVSGGLSISTDWPGLVSPSKKQNHKTKENVKNKFLWQYAHVQTILPYRNLAATGLLVHRTQRRKIKPQPQHILHT